MYPCAIHFWGQFRCRIIEVFRRHDDQIVGSDNDNPKPAESTNAFETSYPPIKFAINLDHTAAIR